MRALQLLRTGLEVSLWQPCVELFSRGREGGREGGRGKERERGREGEREREKEGRGRERERERERESYIATSTIVTQRPLQVHVH